MSTRVLRYPVLPASAADPRFVPVLQDMLRAHAQAIYRLQEEVFIVKCSDEATELTAGAGKMTFRFPWSWYVYEIRAALTVAQGSGSIFTVDVNVRGTTILPTKITIDNGEKTSLTAATKPVLKYDNGVDSVRIDADDEITIDIDQVGAGAKGLSVTFFGLRI